MALAAFAADHPHGTAGGAGGAHGPSGSHNVGAPSGYRGGPPSGYRGVHAPSGYHGVGAPGGYHGVGAPSGYHGVTGPSNYRGVGGPSGSRYSMPPQGFRNAPPNFHGTLPRGGPTPSHVRTHRESGGPGHDLGRYHGHDYGHFTPQERASWRHGAWRHTWHNGHFGWWWFVDDMWFFYPEPIYPYPLYIGSAYYYDYYGEYGAPDYYWYYCEDPPGYYPYIQQCNVPWQPVPPTP